MLPTVVGRPRYRNYELVPQVARAAATMAKQMVLRNTRAFGAAGLAAGAHQVARAWDNARPRKIPRTISRGLRRVSSDYDEKMDQSKKVIVMKRSNVKKDGTDMTFKAPNKRRKRKPKSLAKKVAEVRKLLPKQSVKIFRNFKCLCFPSLTPNQHVVYYIEVNSPTLMESYISQLTSVDSNALQDYTQSNTSVKMDLYSKLMLKNAATGNAHIKYAIVKCKDDDQESAIASIREELIDRGYACPLVTALQASTPTISETPQRLIFSSTTSYHVPLFSGVNFLANWEVMNGGVKKETIGPGDTLDIIWSKRKMVYRPEIKDNEPFAFLANYSYGIILSVMGDICHDQTNTQLVGRGNHQLDGEIQRQAVVYYPNPKGLKEVIYSDTLTNEGFNIPVTADDGLSAIEIQDV